MIGQKAAQNVHRPMKILRFEKRLIQSFITLKSFILQVILK
jgi:hypothetical protein